MCQKIRNSFEKGLNPLTIKVAPVDLSHSMLVLPNWFIEVSFGEICN